MSQPNIIAIDGPAASGKSTLGCRLADLLGYLCLDTGVMYRAVTWAVLEAGVDVDDEAAVSELAWKRNFDVVPVPGKGGAEYEMLVDGRNITSRIRSRKVEENVSQVSVYPQVRQAMTELARRIGRRGKVILMGRDIGTVVFPDADLKIFLVASLEERARRRYEEKLSRGEHATYAEILEGLRQRDEIDSTRAVAPLRAAEDAVLLNSDGLDADGVLAAARKLIE